MILVTGGAGYIGSHVTKDLLDQGYSVLVLDNLSTGNIEAVDKRAIFILGDTGDVRLLDSLFQKFKIEAVMHFAANCLVEESVLNPMRYYQNNVANTLNLIETMTKYNINKFIFSSTCATYGIPTKLPLTEETPQKPINPYGQSKLMIETILKDIAEISSLNYVILRYFNVAGADISGELGESHKPETHLIPNILKHLLGNTDYIKVFGNNYDTNDGTCIRDYIHVTDLSRAHILGLEYLIQNSNKHIKEIFNLGNQKGFSVLEIIQTCEQVTGNKANINFLPCRDGDPPILISSSQRINKVLGWEPQYNLIEIVRTAWNWHQKNKY